MSVTTIARGSSLSLDGSISLICFGNGWLYPEGGKLGDTSVCNLGRDSLASKVEGTRLDSFRCGGNLLLNLRAVELDGRP